MNRCDVCSREIFETKTFFLTTKEIVVSEAYWIFMFRQLVKDLSFTEVKNDSTVFVCQAASSDTPWLVCAECAPMFSFDQATAASKARQWFTDHKFPRGFRLCIIEYNADVEINGNPILPIIVIDDDALNEAFQAARRALSCLEKDAHASVRKN